MASLVGDACDERSLQPSFPRNAVINVSATTSSRLVGFSLFSGFTEFTGV